MDAKLERPFHSRIFRIYISYLEKKLFWNEKQVDQFLADIGVARERLEDDSSWLSVEFADRFYERLRVLTGDDQLAYKAGHYIHENSLSPVIHQLARGLMDVSFFYRLLTRFSGHFTKAAKFNVVSVSSTSAQLESVPLGSFKERPYMCENRRGMLEGTPQIFGLPPAKIIEMECLHRGGKKCLYDLKWEKKSNHTYLVWVVLLYAFAFGWGWLIDISWAIFLSSSVLFLSASLWFRRRFEEQKKELLTQNEVLDQTLKEIERRNQQLQLIGQISQLTNSLMPPDELSKTITRQVCEVLGYDRCILLSTDFEKNVLKVSAYFGFDSHLEDLISQAEFNLNSENSAGFFIKVVNTKSAVLISDISKNLQQLSTRSQKFAKMLETKSFVAVPLLDESQEVVGVLSVDNISAGKVISITDQDLLMTLAQHLGIALHNSKMVKQLEDNLQMSQRLSRDEKVLREVFQKFVPQELSLDLTSASKLGAHGQRLAQVRKRSVSILFLDLVNFSALADALESENVVELLNTAFAVFEPIVASHQGYVDKFLGDGFLAIFEGSDKVDFACQAALGLIDAVERVNKILIEKNYPSIEIGIGINFGPTILGNIGSEQRLNFTAIGDSVNLASRLQTHTRQIGPNSICISASIHEQIDQLQFGSIDLGLITLKGYSEPVHAFQLTKLDIKNSLLKSSHRSHTLGS